MRHSHAHEGADEDRIYAENSVVLDKVYKLLIDKNNIKEEEVKKATKTSTEKKTTAKSGTKSSTSKSSEKKTTNNSETKKATPKKTTKK